ncbi:MAG TPA: glycoside hydrolase family 75 protein [Kofleriaceae bacterium]|nr:glycoside hydrolase family 75 protein [Kofleriaceae bacterium]
MRILHAMVIFAAACGDSEVGPDATDLPDDADPQIDAALPDAAMMVTAAALRAALPSCATPIGGPLAKDSGGTANIPVCGGKRIVFWTADMDIDCDGKESPQCNRTTDPSWQNQTSANDSMGNPLDAATLPFVVIPGVSASFNYRTAGLSMGSVVAVLYQDKLAYGVIGDSGPTAIIGEASYQMAVRLGINPNPRTGGIDNGVTYIAFTGADGKIPKLEDNAAATTLGESRAKMFLAGM